MCDVLEVSPAGYYAWRARPASARAIGQCRAAGGDPAGPHDSGGRYGSPRVHAALRDAGTRRQPRADRAADAPARHPRHHGAAAPGAHDRQPPRSADRAKPARARLHGRQRPNQVWLADITYIPTGEGWLYLAGRSWICFSRKIVGWAMRDHLRAELASAALTMAIQRQRPGAGSDPSLRSRHAIRLRRLSHALQAAGITASMSRKADCWDNAPMESFFHTLKTELVHHRNYPTRAEAQRDIFAFIEGFYNRTRLHSAIG